MPRPGRGVALCGDAREGDNQHRAGGVSTRRSSAGFSAARAGRLGFALPRAWSDLVERNWPYLLHQVRDDGGCATLWSRWRTPPSKPSRADLLAEAGPPPICSARPARRAHRASVSPYAARDMEEPAVAIGAWGWWSGAPSAAALCGTPPITLSTRPRLCEQLLALFRTPRGQRNQRPRRHGARDFD